jgi:hypothetical protein
MRLSCLCHRIPNINFPRSVTHNKSFIFILWATNFGSILSHHQAFSTNVDTESLKLHYNGDLPLTLKFVIYVYKHVNSCLIQDAFIKKYAGNAVIKLPLQVPEAVDVCLTSTNNFNKLVSNNP